MNPEPLLKSLRLDWATGKSAKPEYVVKFEDEIPPTSQVPEPEAPDAATVAEHPDCDCDC